VQTVYLKGELGERFGEKWNMNIHRVQDIFKLIKCQRDGFDAYMQHCLENDIDFAVQRGEDYIDESELMLSLGKEDITITPIPVGSKSKVAKLITAAFMIYVGYQMGVPPEATMTTGTHSSGVASVTATQATVGTGMKIASWTMMTLGTSLGLQTLAEMMMPDGSTDNEDDSHLFSGPQNTTVQGAAVPVLYGEMIVGGANINTSYTAHKGRSYIPGIGVMTPLGVSEGSGEVDMQIDEVLD